jgi:hypothetical protein
MVQLHWTGSGGTDTNGVVEFEGKSSVVGAGSGNIAGIIRADSGDNYALVLGDFLNQQSVIAKTITNAYSTLATTPLTFNAGTMYHFRGYMNGTALQSWVNGSNAVSVTDSSRAGGYVGLVASSTSGSTAQYTFDDVAFYSSPTITMNNLPSGGSWAVSDHSGIIACQTGSTWNLSTYTGQVPIDYDNSGGSVSVWTNNTCSGAPDQTYATSTSIFGGDTYTYAASTGPGTSSPGGIVQSTSTITISSVGGVSY